MTPPRRRFVYLRRPGGLQCAGFAQSRIQRAFAVIRPERHAFGHDEFHVGDADEAEHRAQIGLRMFGCRIGRFRPVQPAAQNDDDDALAAGQPGRAAPVGVYWKVLPRHQDAVDPGLQLAGHGEIIHRRADHDGIGGLEHASSAAWAAAAFPPPCRAQRRGAMTAMWPR